MGTDGGDDDGEGDEGDDGDAEGEEGRGTVEKGGLCNHKEEGSGCVLNFCCAIAESIDASGIEGATEDEIKAGEEGGMKEADKAKEKGEGVCLADDKTEFEMPDGSK